ncbi:hypothetical protein CRG98_033598 [Punica granatum]|uniref:Uncharacterized protein n=1 Tax=Punica granatum TaxID=22663 RepID=A0A2I0IPM7_PUNGR|nr:hypothetical protein CRG98_033598 [Punica granatum]
MPLTSPLTCESSRDGHLDEGRHRQQQVDEHRQLGHGLPPRLLLGGRDPPHSSSSSSPQQALALFPFFLLFPFSVAFRRRKIENGYSISRCFPSGGAAPAVLSPKPIPPSPSTPSSSSLSPPSSPPPPPSSRPSPLRRGRRLTLAHRRPCREVAVGNPISDMP